MIFLVSNDDGINAAGIKALATALMPYGDVYVSAPENQMSCTSHCISVLRDMTVKKVDYPGAKEAWAVDGSPADCVKIGIQILGQRGLKPDFVFSGINHGSNLGTDTVYSGTIAAAMEGSINNICSMALSVDSRTPEHLDVVASFAPIMLRAAIGRQDPKTVLSLNMLDIPREAIRGVKYTKLGNRAYAGEFEPIEPVEDGVVYKYSGTPVIPEDDTTFDVGAVYKGYVSISPIRYDFTAHDKVDDVKDWFAEGGFA